jgi:hypothetical protein
MGSIFNEKEQTKAKIHLHIERCPQAKRNNTFIRMYLTYSNE